MANLFKLQIGPQKHWNVYAHSFLYFGVVSAYNPYNLFHAECCLFLIRKVYEFPFYY